MPFADRVTAGRALAEVVAERGPVDASVLAVPRGGVPVGLEIARRLGVPLDVALVGKLRAPGRADFAIGAVGEDGYCVVSEVLTRILGVGDAELTELKSRVRQDLAARSLRIRWQFPLLPLEGRSVVIADDALVTGASAVVAARFARANGAARVTVAVPEATDEGVELVATEVDDIVSLESLHPSRIVGRCFGPGAPSDDDVLELLALGRPSEPPPGPGRLPDHFPEDHRPAGRHPRGHAPAHRAG